MIVDGMFMIKSWTHAAHFTNYTPLSFSKIKHTKHLTWFCASYVTENKELQLCSTESIHNDSRELIICMHILYRLLSFDRKFLEMLVMWIVENNVL